MNLEAAKNTAYEMLDDNWDNLFPVKVMRFIRLLGLDVFVFGPNAPQHIAGAYVPHYTRNGNKPTILVSPRESREFRRFVLAHEMGHNILHYDMAFRDSFHMFAGDDPFELEADEFAFTLLMPEKPFRLMVESGDYTAQKLCQCFGVTAATLDRRLKSLGYDPAVWSWVLAKPQKA